MIKVFCREIGLDCDYVMEGDTEGELFRNGEKHAFNKHGIKQSEFIPYFNVKVRPKIKS